MHEKTLDEAKKRLFGGQLVIFPTETVYGIGGNANNKSAVQLIYKTKERPINNPLICHFSNIADIPHLASAPTIGLPSETILFPSTTGTTPLLGSTVSI